jgi:hypothetical protein
MSIDRYLHKISIYMIVQKLGKHLFPVDPASTKYEDRPYMQRKNGGEIPALLLHVYLLFLYPFTYACLCFTFMHIKNRF